MAELTSNQIALYDLIVNRPVVSTTTPLIVEDELTTSQLATSTQTNLFMESLEYVQNAVASTANDALTTAADVVSTHNDVITTTAQANIATIARQNAETARDAAQLSARIYSTVSEGLANTIIDTFFNTISANNNEYLILYKHTASGAVEINKYPSVAGIEYTVANTLYVKSNGNDSKDGQSSRNALATIEEALRRATARGPGSRTYIDWAADSVVYTNGYLDMPDNCVIKATHRTVFLRPNEGTYVNTVLNKTMPIRQRNVIRMGSGCFVEGVMFEGWQLDDLDNPTEGFAVSFRPGAVITRVPYAHKIAVRTSPIWGIVAPPLDRAAANPAVPISGGVVLADGAVCSQYSIFPNIMTWGATPVLPNGIGYCAKNGGLVNAVNAVSMWAHKHFLALSGGQIILSSCATQFGDYSMVSKGKRNIIEPYKITGATLTPLPADALLIKNNAATIVANMWQDLQNKGYFPPQSTAASVYTNTINDGTLLLQCLNWTLEWANEQPMLDFAKGMFNVMGMPVYLIDHLPAYMASYANIRLQISQLPGITQTAINLVRALFIALEATLVNPQKRSDPSRITAIGHTWTAVMAGVALTKIPPALNQATIQDSLLELEDGVIIASGQDDQGNALFVGGLEINADTGELGGAPFDQAVRRVATRAAISRSF